MKKKIEKRLVYLYSGELISTILFILVSFLWNHSNPGLHLYSLYSFWAAFLVLECLLLQGTFYWYTKLKRLRAEQTSVTPERTVRQLKRMQKINVFLLAAGVPAFAADFIKWSPSWPVEGLLIAGGIYVFAILEFINYFHFQLSYDNKSDISYLLKTKKLKQAPLRKDFARIASR